MSPQELACKKQTQAYSESHSVVFDPLQPHGLYSPWNSPGQNPGVDSLYLLQGIFPTQGSNPGFPHCRRILYQLSCQGRPFLRATSRRPHGTKEVTSHQMTAWASGREVGRVSTGARQCPSVFRERESLALGEGKAQLGPAAGLTWPC